MNKILIPGIILIFLLGCKQKEASDKAGTLVKDKSIKVSMKQVKSENDKVMLNYSGSVEASHTIPLSFRTNGTVEKVLVDEGDLVKKGQLLATINDTDAQNLYEITQSKYIQADDAYSRLKSVYDKGSLPEIKWVEMETNLMLAKSSLEISKNNLEKCKLISPANGIIGRRNIEPGMLSISLAGSPLEIVNIKTVNVKISIPENEISTIQKGLKAEINVSALGNKKYEGKIINVSPVADKFSRTYNAKIEVKNRNYELKPGMVCDVKINLQFDNSIVLVPYPSITQDECGNVFVFLVDKVNKRAIKQPVEVGNYVGSYVEVLSGLKEGQEIVCEGKYKLIDNSSITW